MRRCAAGLDLHGELPWEASVPAWLLELLQSDDWFNHEAAASELGYAPQVALLEGLANTAQWISRNGIEASEEVLWD